MDFTDLKRMLLILLFKKRENFIKPVNYHIFAGLLSIKIGHYSSTIVRLNKIYFVINFLLTIVLIFQLIQSSDIIIHTEVLRVQVHAK